MPLGYARGTFAGADFYGIEYLNLEDGEPMVIVHPNVNEGWILAAKIRGGQWCTGWIPATYWATQKVEEHRLEDFFCEETYGNLADVIVKYLGRAGPGTSPSRYSPAGAFIQTAKTIATYVTVNMEERRKWEQIAFWEEAFPTIRTDVERYGMPARMHNFPEWTSWELLVEVYYQPYSPAAVDFGEGWHHWERHWLKNISEVERAMEGVQRTAGLYRHMQYCVEEWCWDYIDQNWAPRNHI